ncbi:MAG: ATP-binding cassette domain-containing protein, partial [Saprospiraceae bacterium]
TGVVIYGFNKLLYRVSVRRRNNRSRMLSFVHERLLAISTIKAFNKEVPERKKFAKHSARLYDSGLKFQAIYSFIYTLVPGMSYMVLGLVLLVIFTLKDGGAGIDSGAMLSFILLFITVLPVFRRTMRVHTVWEVGNISFEKLLRVIALEPDQQHRKKFRFRTGEIVLENLGFGFLGKRPLFAGLNLRFRPGHITVARAQRGAGKTTLIKLMTGIYTPQKGRLLIDGQSLEQVDLKSLRRHVATVSEAFPLLGKTVFEAISYSRAPEKKTAAAKVLNTLQQGVPVAMRLRLDDKTGYQGRLLSAGQRKVLLYARAMLTGKPVLLVDEPFGGLPPDVRAQVTRWFLHKKRSGTIVLFTSEWNDDWLRPNAVAGLGAPQNNSTDTPEKGTSPAGNGEKTLAS